MVHGERDAQRRFYDLWKRMDDDRPAILLSEGAAAFRSSRTHVDNAARAVVLAATDDRASSRVYNVGEPDALSTLEWARQIARLVGWHGDLVVAAGPAMPAHLADPRPDFYAQHLVADTSRIRRELGYREIVAREDGLRRAIEWYAAEPPLDPVASARLNYAAEDAALLGLGERVRS
jgi:nucleoside-diphosphate-sugar epimerase